MQQLVRSESVLVIVLRHVVRQARHVAHLPAAVAGCQVAVVGTSAFQLHSIPNLENFLGRPGTTKSHVATCLLPS